ncbi:MAG: site-specific DNA-methyltransferase, partial [Planctomycetota bacterium]
KLGRRPIGFELSQEYAKRGQERLDAVHSGEPLVGSADPLQSAPATGSRQARKLGERRPVLARKQQRQLGFEPGESE